MFQRKRNPQNELAQLLEIGLTQVHNEEPCMVDLGEVANYLTTKIMAEGDNVSWRKYPKAHDMMEESLSYIYEVI